MIISIDHGNKQIKTDRRIFTSGLKESDTKPPIGNDFLKYRGKYYTLSNNRIPYMRDKTIDNRYYILTLFSIAFEIEDAGYYEEDVLPIKLLVGLPPAHFGSQYEKFEKYFQRDEIEKFEFHGKQFKIYINEVTAFPQAFAAAMPAYNTIKEYPKVLIVDIGGFTVDYLMIKKGQPDLTVCDTLENGVIVLYNQIIARINSDLDMLLEESDVDIILKECHEYNDEVKRIVFDCSQTFVNDLFAKLRERMIDLRSGKIVFVGGGSILLSKQINSSRKVNEPIFIETISANAKGYEILYKAAKAGR